MITGGCGSSAETTASTERDDGGGVPSVMVTTDIWGDVIANVACDEMADIQTLIPAGVDPHAYEPSLQDRASLDQASLVVANGLDLEHSVQDLLRTVETEGTPVFEMADHVPTIGDDPHIWWDPSGVRDALPALADALVLDLGLDRAAVDSCVAAYQEQLDDVDAEMVDILSVVAPEDRLLVTSHDSLAYFAKRYDFTVIGTVIPSSSTVAEADPASMAALTNLIEETGVRAIFAEPQHSADEANALAERVGGVTVVTSYTDTLGEAGSGFDTYVGFLRSNAQVFADALR